MRFHLCHVVPDAHMHGLQGYAEVIESIRWGVEQLGHAVSVAVNVRLEEADAVNIIFGAQMLTPDEAKHLPANSVIYNLEQIANGDLALFKPALHEAARRCHIWDYDARNLETWKKLRPAHDPVLVPIGWATSLERIPKRPESEQEIEVLMYGSPVENRLRVVWQLGDHNYKVVFASGVYGQLRDDLISRSKVVVNVNRYPKVRAFEMVRVSYLLGNGKAVVSDLYPEYQVDEDLRQAIAFAPLEKIAETCMRVVVDGALRKRLEATGPEVMRRRDIRNILEAPLALLR